VAYKNTFTATHPKFPDFTTVSVFNTLIDFEKTL